MTRAQLRRRLRDRERLARRLIVALERAGCHFWACPGPRVRPVNMRTCYRCGALYAVSRTKGLLPDEAGGEAREGDP